MDSNVDPPIFVSPIEDADIWHSRVWCTVLLECSQLPAHMELINETYILPDPLKFLDDQRTGTNANWACRAAQVRALIQEYELGYKSYEPV